MNYFYASIYAMLLFTFDHVAQAATRELRPASDGQVIESLAPRLNTVVVNTVTAQSAVNNARQAIVLARQTADPRYLGRAQAMLSPWWDKQDAPVEIAVLQATIMQSRHEFAPATQLLEKTLARDPNNAQAWLTLATLHRLAARYDLVLQACESLTRAGATPYAQACKLETISLMGQHSQALRGLDALFEQTKDPSIQAWLLSLQAEAYERAGFDAKALAAYRSSLQINFDGYTALALTDMLLRKEDFNAALVSLDKQPSSDAVLLRRAYALKRLGDARWKALAVAAQERFAALDARGDDPATHARERALAYAWLEDNMQAALKSALLNLQLQKEPLDWRIALQAAHAAGQTQELQKLRHAIAEAGLQDARLLRWQK